MLNTTGDLDATPMMHESENETYARDVQLSIDGQVLAYIAGSRLVVIETLDGYVRVDEDFGFTSDALCMSGDGTYIGYQLCFSRLIITTVTDSKPSICLSGTKILWFTIMFGNLPTLGCMLLVAQ